MEASMSYQVGKPIMSDSEYDELKGALRKKNSKVVQQVNFVWHKWMDVLGIFLSHAGNLVSNLRVSGLYLQLNFL